MLLCHHSRHCLRSPPDASSSHRLPTHRPILQEGLEAPPEEELPDSDLMLDADEDLSFASMFAAALEVAGSGDKTSEQGVGQPDAGSAASRPSLGITSAGGSLFQGIDVDAMAVGSMEPTPPRSVKPGSIALGGLLAGTPGSPFGSVPSSSPFGGFGTTPSPLGDPRPSQLGGQRPLGDPAAMHLVAPPPVVASLPGGPAPVSCDGTYDSLGFTAAAFASLCCHWCRIYY